MKKNYLFTLLLLGSFVFANAADTLLVVNLNSDQKDRPEWNKNWDFFQDHITAITDALNSLDNVYCESITVDSVLNSEFNYSKYSAVVLSEVPGSSDAAKLGLVTEYLKLPSVCMKMYALKVGKSGFAWIPDTDFYGEKSIWDSLKVKEQTVMKIENQHAIFSNYFTVGDEIELYGGTKEAGAHFQTGDFSKSGFDYIKNNITTIGSSPHVKKVTKDTVSSDLMWAVEASTDLPRYVIWGVHGVFTKETEDWNKILKNSLLWVLKKPVLASVKSSSADITISTYPNPVTEELTVKFTNKIAGNVNVSLYDLTGKLLLTDSEYLTQGVQSRTIDCTAIANGMYLLKVENASGISAETIIIQ